MRWLCAVLVIACASPEEGHSPVARIAIAPRAIPEGDGFATDVVLDAGESADPVDDPDGTMALRYRWRLEDDAARFEDGRETDAVVTVRFEGRRPARIALTVTDPDGLEATAVDRLALTVR